MNKIVLALATLALLGVSCKKDRNCTCKDISKYVTPSVTTESSEDYTKVMKEVSYLTAMKACVHSKDEYVINDTTKILVDSHCSLD